MNENNMDTSLEDSTISETDVIYHECIGRGSDGEVYRITWKSKDCGDVEAAAKKIPQDPKSIETLWSAIQMAKNLNHENVIKYFGHIVTKFHVIIVMEYAAKGSLFRYLSARRESSTGRLASAQIHTWANEAAKGIQYLRKIKFVHRDIKSPNYLIMADNTLKLCDFGLAKYLPKTITTLSGRGTPRWLAPEVWRDLKLSPKADVFAFGIVLWELVTGDEPYKGMEAMHVIYSVCQYGLRPEIPQQCPDVYKTLMLQCWDADKDKRPTIDEVVSALDGTQEKFGFPPGPPGRLQVSNIGTTQMTVSWEPPDDVGESPVIGYLLKYNVKSGTEWTIASQSFTAKPSFRVTGLKAGCHYQFAVNAVNEGGHGHESEPLKATTVADRRIYIFISALLAFFAYAIYFIKCREDFSEIFSWTLKNQFRNQQWDAFGDIFGAQSIGDILEGFISLTASRPFYLVITALLAFCAYVMYTIINREDFSEISSWSLAYQFGHQQLNAFGDIFGAQSIAVNPLNGDIAVADWYSTKIKVYGRKGKIKFGLDTTEGSPPQTGEKSHPRDIAVSSNGAYFVTNQTPYVKIFNINGVFTHELECSYIAEERSRLSGITFDSKGNLVVGEYRFKSISIHSQDGAHLKTFNTDLKPRYLAITPSDDIVVSSWEPHAAQILSRTGEVLHTLYAPKEVKHGRPTGVSCSKDVIFVANDDKSAQNEYGIYCYSLSGKYLGCATKAVTNPTGVAVIDNGEKLLVAQWERGNPMEGSGVHGVKIFRREHDSN